jgi:predicted lipoprotein
MKKLPVKIFILLAALILLVIAGRYGFTVVKIEDVEKKVQSEKFDPAGYVTSIWADKLIPAFNEKSIELSGILSKFQLDENGLIKKDDLIKVTNENGLITVGEAHVYMVKGSGKITAVNTDTSMGTIEVALDGYSGPIKVLLYIGTRIPSDETSVRDSVGFITFGNFKEQTEYGKVASEINKKVLTQVLNDVDKTSLLNKTITFKGAFNIRTFNLIQIDLKAIRVVPVEIELGD